MESIFQTATGAGTIIVGRPRMIGIIRVTKTLLNARYKIATVTALSFLAGAVLAQERAVELSPQSPTVWKSSLGEGFNSGANELNVSFGVGLGMKVLLSEHSHDWAISMFQYGWVFSDVVGQGHWYGGNWELLGELFGGAQFNPDTAYVIGGGPLLRYNFATGHRWVPFIDVGGGVAATDIRNGDLSTTFEFNLQAGAGVHVFLREDLALTFQYRLIHLSNAGLKFPNLGLNTSTFLAGVTWWF